MGIGIIGLTEGGDLAMFTLGVLSPVTNSVGMIVGYAAGFGE